MPGPIRGSRVARGGRKSKEPSFAKRLRGERRFPRAFLVGEGGDGSDDSDGLYGVPGAPISGPEIAPKS
jgi:hypothetical protein